MNKVTDPWAIFSTSLGNANWYDLLSQDAGLVCCFAAAVRADGVGVLLLSGDAAVLGCVLCTVPLLKKEDEVKFETDKMKKETFIGPYL